MNQLAVAFVWCAIQVTLFGTVAAVLYAITRRMGPHVRAMIACSSLLVIAALTSLLLSPWPRWTWESSSRRNPTDKAEVLVTGTPLAGDANRNAKNDPAVRSSSENVSAGEPAPEPIHWRETLRSTWERLRDPSALQEAIPPLWIHIIAIVASLAAVAGFIRLVAGMLLIYRLRRDSLAIEDDDWLEELDNLRVQLGCTRLVELRESSALITPAVVGWKRPAILLPASRRNLSAQQRQAVLAHELAHVRRRDFIANVWAQIGLALHFYHPLVHWLAGRLRLEQELAADDDAAVVAGGRRAYLIVLGEIALEQPNVLPGWPAHAFLPTHSVLLRRIKMLRQATNFSGGKRAGMRFKQSVAAGVLLLAAVGISGVRGRFDDSAGEKRLTADDVVACLNARHSALRNVQVEFNRTIYLPPVYGEETVVTITRDERGMIESKDTVTQKMARPEERITTRHILMAAGPDLVRVESFQRKPDSDEANEYFHYHTTINWPDERRMIPVAGHEPVSIHRGQPDRLGEEAIGNSHAFLMALELSLAKEGGKGRELADVCEAEWITFEGQRLIRLHTNPLMSLLECELLIDPEKSYMVRRISSWKPRRFGAQEERVTTYDKPIQDDRGVWFPSLIQQESFRFEGKGASREKALVKREVTIIEKLKTNLRNLDVASLFERSLPAGRVVIDYRSDQDGVVIQNATNP